MVSLRCGLLLLALVTVCALAVAVPSYVSHYDPANPLQIKVKAPRSDNYFLMLGDWGKPPGLYAKGDCQDKVKDMMWAYVKKQTAAGKNLLFIAAIGDNFYFTGVDKNTDWAASWSTPYGVHDSAVNPPPPSFPPTTHHRTTQPPTHSNHFHPGALVTHLQRALAGGARQPRSW